MDYLFVYGTLLDPENPVAQFLQSNAEFYAEGYFYGKLYDLGDYPGAVISENQTDKVFGKILVIKNYHAVFNVLDNYEETGEEFQTPNEFIRMKISVFDSIGKIIPCQVYLYNWPVEHFQRIVSGRYDKK